MAENVPTKVAVKKLSGAAKSATVRSSAAGTPVVKSVGIMAENVPTKVAVKKLSGAAKSATVRSSAAGAPVVKSDRSHTEPVKASSISTPDDVPRKAKTKPIAEKVQASGDSWDPSTVSALMEDRDFYYSKLCDIEVICHQSGDNGEGLNIQHILAILYATRKGYGPPKRAGN